MSHYNISFLDDKTTAWINLAQVMAGVYGTRIMAAKLRRDTEARTRAEARAHAADDQANAAHRSPTAPSAPATTRISVQQPGLPSVQLPIGEP